LASSEGRKGENHWQQKEIEKGGGKKEECSKKKKVEKQRAIERLSYPLFLCHFTAGLLVRMLQML
jgi:hypothetical protein